MVWRMEDPQGNEARKIRHLLVPYTRGRGLDLGCGPYKAWPHFIGVDVVKGVDVKQRCDDLSMFATGEMDFVFSSHLLEHMEDPEACLAEWWRVVAPGRYLCLYLPHKDLYPNMGEEGANPDHKHDFNPDDIIDMMMALAGRGKHGCEMIEGEPRSAGREYSFFQVYRKGEKNNGGYFDFSTLNLQWSNVANSRRLLLIRYGAFGDQMMVSSALPLLKEQGWHITYNTTPQGQDILREDPHIDDWWIQDKDQVPNEQLGDYWEALDREPRWDKVINLSESIEGTLLPRPGNRTYVMSTQARRALMGKVNYFEHTHRLCEVPERPIRPRFYPTDQERENARVRKSHANGPVVVWSIGGSSVHKVYPFLDNVVARLMLETNATVVLTGGELESIAEQPWESEKRVWKKCGKWTIREAMAFAQVADVVVGPETGLLNAVAHEKVPKVLFLSHSSKENLTRHWRNTETMRSFSALCHPCHRMHYSFEHCNRDERTGAAACAAGIPMYDTFDAIVRAINGNHLQHADGAEQADGGVDPRVDQQLAGAGSDDPDDGGGVDVPSPPGTGNGIGTSPTAPGGQ